MSNNTDCVISHKKKGDYGMKSKNIVFTQAKKVELWEEDVPAPKENEVLCRTDYSLISIGTETTCLNGVFDEGTNWKEWVQYPFYPGYSNVATVIEVGSAVKDYQVGDRVFSAMTHNQYFTANSGLLIRVPDDVSSVDATWLALLRVTQNIVRKCQVQMGDTVVIVGQGQVGQLVTQFVRNCGAMNIIAIDPIADRLKMSKQSGATHVFSCSAKDAVEDIKKITNGKMADIVIDSTGHPKVLAQVCELARCYGKIGLVGDCSCPSQQAIGPGVVSNSLSILGMHSTMTAPIDNAFYPWTERFINEISLGYLEQKRLEVSHLVTHTCSPENATEIFEGLLNNRAAYMGVVFDWSLLNKE